MMDIDCPTCGLTNSVDECGDQYCPYCDTEYEVDTDGEVVC